MELLEPWEHPNRAGNTLVRTRAGELFHFRYRPKANKLPADK